MNEGYFRTQCRHCGALVYEGPWIPHNNATTSIGTTGQRAPPLPRNNIRHNQRSHSSTPIRSVSADLAHARHSKIARTDVEKTSIGQLARVTDRPKRNPRPPHRHRTAIPAVDHPHPPLNQHAWPVVTPQPLSTSTSPSRSRARSRNSPGLMQHGGGADVDSGGVPGQGGRCHRRRQAASCSSGSAGALKNFRVSDTQPPLSAPMTTRRCQHFASGDIWTIWAIWAIPRLPDYACMTASE